MIVCSPSEKISAPSLQVGLGQLHRRLLQVEPVDEDEVGLGEDCARRRGPARRCGSWCRRARCRGGRSGCRRRCATIEDDRRDGGGDVELAVVLVERVVPAERLRSARRIPAPRPGRSPAGPQQTGHTGDNGAPAAACSGDRIGCPCYPPDPGERSCGEETRPLCSRKWVQLRISAYAACGIIRRLPSWVKAPATDQWQRALPTAGGGRR